MAATLVVQCPECNQPVKVTVEMEGKKVRCQACKTAFTVKLPGQAKAKSVPKPPAAKGPAPSPPPKPAAPKPPGGDDDDDDPNPYKLTYENLATRCPHCAQELESEDAVVCLNCGYNLQTRERATTKRVVEQTGADQFLWLLPGILSVLGGLTAIGLAVWGIIWRFNYTPPADSDNKKVWTGAATCAATWLVVFCGFTIYYLIHFAVKRLIFNPKPPDKIIDEDAAKE